MHKQTLLENISRFQSLRKDRCIPTDLVTPLYEGMTNNILLGTKEEEGYTARLLKDVLQASPAKGKKIYWMHTIPFWSDAVKKELMFQEKAQIVGCELAHTFDLDEYDFDPRSLMKRWHCKDGLSCAQRKCARRIDNGINHAKKAGADGVVWFNIGAASTRWERPGSQKRSLKNRESRSIESWMVTVVTEAMEEKDRQQPRPQALFWKCWEAKGEAQDI